ncbi:MAG: heavy metal-binding domain-containing protein [Candidatus Diapherotrites archaeon]|nr:heavy metal-binding domain-containing protein [Candidatus Diapherotrites archaeon]
MEERIHKTILITPVENPPGVKVISSKGLVYASVVDVIPPHLELLTLFSTARRKSSPISRFISTLFHRAMLSLEEKAKKLGANAVLGLKVEISYLGWGRVSLLAYGMAAEVEA